MYYVDNKIRGKQVQQPLFGDFNTAAFVVGVFSSSSSSFDPLAAGEERERERRRKLACGQLPNGRK